MEKEKIEIMTVENPLDSIGCSCSSCNEPQKDIQDVVRDEKQQKQGKGIIWIRENIQLILGFVFFFTALFFFNKSLDLGLYLIAYILVARKVLIKAVKNVMNGQMLDENFLMAIASIVAFLIGEYAEGVAVMLFYAVGGLTEEYALNRSKSSISKLLDLKPDFANVLTFMGYEKMEPSKVQKGARIMVKPGEKIPLDGVVIKGRSTVDASMLTGESLPVAVDQDDQVYSGTVNLDGVIEVEVTKTYEHSTVAKIMEMVNKASQNKAKTEKFITKFAKVYTPLVVLTASLIAVVPTLLGGSFETWLYRGAIFLVVSCPCALVISVPLGYFGGIGGAARRGILVKGGHFLEALKKTKTIVLDKTGTLTKGNFKMDHWETYGMTEEEVLKLAAHLESFSNHPIAKAVVKAYEGHIDQAIVEQVVEYSGKGLKGRIQGREVLIGNDALMLEHLIDIQASDFHGTRIYLAVDQVQKGVFFINDELKEHTKEGLDQLKALGVENFVMLTGDRQIIADQVAEELGITQVHAELMPGEKLSILESLLSKDDKVVFVGDGINDAPVLTRADVGIAMGNLGSDVAIESSDVVLMTDEITKVAEGIRVARFTSTIIWQNIILALGIKVIIMILGTLGIANLWTAVFGDVGVAFIAILNSGRAIYKK